MMFNKKRYYKILQDRLILIESGISAMFFLVYTFLLSPKVAKKLIKIQNRECLSL